MIQDLDKILQARIHFFCFCLSFRIVFSAFNKLQGGDMRRRTFLISLGIAAVAPFAFFYRPKQALAADSPIIVERLKNRGKHGENWCHRKPSKFYLKNTPKHREAVNWIMNIAKESISARPVICHCLKVSINMTAAPDGRVSRSLFQGTSVPSAILN